MQHAVFQYTLFDSQIQLWPFRCFIFFIYFNENYAFSSCFMINSSICVSTWHLFSAPCMCLGQRKKPKCKWTFGQWFAAVFERWCCFAIKSAAHTSSLNEVLISHSSIQMHLYFHLYLSAYTVWQMRGISLPSFWFPKTISLYNTDIWR